MNKVRGKFALTLTLMFLLANFTGFIHSSAAVKKPVIPQIKFVKTPSTTYTAGDRVKFDIYAPNCSSTVEYRVVLWDGNKKTYSDLWNSSNGCPTHYYTKWRPNGRTTFKLGWNINEPGSYRITVYVKRVGVAPNKAHLSKYNCDSYMQSAVFTVKPKALILNKEGATYGSTDSNNRQVVKTNINIAAKNITYNNADIIGDAYLSADNITLKNFHVYGTLFLDPGINSSFNLDDVHADKIEIKSLRDGTYEFKNVTTGELFIKTKNNVTFKAGSGTSIQNTIINEDTNIENAEGSFGNVYLSGSSTTPITVNVKGDFDKPITIQKSAILNDDKNWTSVKISPTNNESITATLNGYFWSINILKNSTVKLGSNSWVRSLTSYANASVYADESITIDDIKNNTDTLSLYIYGKIKYTNEDGAIFVNDNSVLPTSSDIKGNIYASLYYCTIEKDNNICGVNAEPVLRMSLCKEDGSPLNILRGGRFFIYNGRETLSFKYYNGDEYTLPVNKDDGTIKIAGGNYKIYAPVYVSNEVTKWYVLNFTAKQISKTGVNRSEITSVNGKPYKFTRWTAPKYSILSNGTKKTYVTIGSTIDDVIRILGKAPSSIGEREDYDLLYYYPRDKFSRPSPGDNYIQLVMINGKYTVVGWSNNGAMNAKLEAAVSTAPPVNIGSTMAEVAKAMGTPRLINHYYDEDEWVYNKSYNTAGKWTFQESHVYFCDGIVYRWTNGGNLKVNLGTKDPSAPPFKFGSTMQSVIKTMGTPTEIDESSWASLGTTFRYGESTVIFSPTTGLVKTWNNAGNLNVSLGSIDPQASPFALGSSMEDVVKANGTPRVFTTESDGSFKWDYAILSSRYNTYSTVEFDKNGKVVGWDNRGDLKLWLGDKDPSAPEIKVGSTREDVVKYLGAPWVVNGNRWRYEHYDIDFDTNGIVSSVYKS